MAPLIFAGVEPVLTPFVISFLAALGLLGLMWVGVRAREGWTAAGLAMLLLATTPGFLVLARAPMADLSSCCWVVASMLALVRFYKTGKLTWGVIGALLLGLASCFRLGNVFFVPVMVIAWFIARRRLERPTVGGLSMALAFALGVAPQLLYQWRTFGHPLATGYGFWLPELSAFLDAFGSGNLVNNLRYLARDALQLEWKTTVATYYGDGSYFGPASLCLLGVSCVWGLRGRAARLFALCIAAYAVAMLFYFFQDARFYAPLFPLAAMFVAAQTCRIMRSGSRPLKKVVIALAMMHVLGIPGSTSVAALPQLVLDRSREPALRYDLVVRLRSEPPGLVLSTFSQPYVHALLGKAWTVSPAVPGHEYGRRPDMFRYEDADRTRQVLAFRSRKLPIYVIADKELQDVLTQLSVPKDTRWRILASGKQRGGVAHLAPTK